MKIILSLMAVLTVSSTYGQAEKEFLRYYLRSLDNKADTAYYCKVVSGNKGYCFIFPELESKYYHLKDSAKMVFDTIIERRISVFGPYKFKKRGTKILFRDFNRSKKYFDLYNLSEGDFLAPDLFSSSTDSYNILTKLLDSNYLIHVSDRSVSCFKYLQFVEHYYRMEFRVVYIDKRTLLPYKLEYYSNRELDKMNREIFAVPVVR